MSRDEGFTIADCSTSHLDDPKVKAMWRTLAPDADRMNRALVLHQATVLMSWREGRRVTALDAAPAWQLVIDEAIADLTDNELLDHEGKVPRRSFQKWYGAAKRRRDLVRAEWRDRQAKRRARVKSQEDTPGESRVTPRIRPTDPSDTDRPPRTRRARGAGLTPIDGGQGDEAQRQEAIARAQAKLDDPDSSEDVKEAARFALRRLGVQGTDQAASA